MVSTLTFAVAAFAILPSFISARPMISSHQSNITTASEWIQQNYPDKYQECTPETMTVRKNW